MVLNRGDEVHFRKTIPRSQIFDPTHKVDLRYNYFTFDEIIYITDFAVEMWQSFFQVSIYTINCHIKLYHFFVDFRLFFILQPEGLLPSNNYALPMID